MELGRMDTKISSGYDLGGMLANQQDISTKQYQTEAAAAAFPASLQQQQLENQKSQMDMQAQQVQRQRTQQARDIYQGSLDEKGNLDSQKYYQGLNQSGLSEFVQQHQGFVADLTAKNNKASYDAALAGASQMSTLSAKAQEQSRLVWQGALNLYQHYPKLVKSEGITAGSQLDPHEIDAYANFYNTVKSQGLGDSLDTPEQFLANPSMALQKVHQIANEAENRFAQALEKQKADADTLRAQADWYKALHPPAMAMFGQKVEQRTEDKIVKLKEDLDAAKNVRNAFGVAELGLTRVERMESLGKAFHDTGKLRDAEIRELATGLNSVLAGSNVGTEHQIEELVPKSAIGNAQKIIQWWQNEPRGMNQKKFVDRMMASIDREKRTMTAQIKREQYQRLTAWDFVRRDAPTEWEKVVRGAGVKPDEYDAWIKKGQPEISAVQEPEAPGVIQPTPGQISDADLVKDFFAKRK